MSITDDDDDDDMANPYNVDPRFDATLDDDLEEENDVMDEEDDDLSS